MPDRLLKTSQVASHLGLSRFQVGRMISRGDIPARQVGRCFYVRRGDLEELGLLRPIGLREEWEAIAAPLSVRYHELVAAMDPDLDSRVAVVRTSVEAAGEMTREQDRDLFDFVMLATTSGEAAALALEVGSTTHRALAAGLAARAGRSHPNVDDLVGADWYIPFRSTALRAVVSGQRRYCVDACREIAEQWGVALPRVFPAANIRRKGDVGANRAEPLRDPGRKA